MARLFIEEELSFFENYDDDSKDLFLNFIYFKTNEIYQMIFLFYF